MSATSPINPTSASGSNSGNSSSKPSNVLSSASNIVVMENQFLDSNDVVAAASLQQLSNAGTLKLTRDCAVQYSNLINSYSASSISSGSSSISNSSSNGGATIVSSNSPHQLSTVNIIPGDASQSSSRVQVLSNVQLVSKGGPQQSTFSYVDASGKNFNVLTSSGKISANKLISVPITKVKTIGHISQHQPQQSHIVSSPVHQQQTQAAQPGSMQKVTGPRSIQLVTRIQNPTISVSNGRVSQIASAVSSPMQQQQQQTQQFTIQQYPDSSANIPSGLEIKSSMTAGPFISSTNVGKTVAKNKSTASLKVMQNPLPSQAITKQQVGKGMSVNLKSVRNSAKATLSGPSSQYYVKSSVNSSFQQGGTTTSIYTTSPAQAVYHSPTPHPPQQPIQYPIGTTITTKGGKSIYKSKNQLIQLQQHQPMPHQSPQRTTTSANPIGTITSNPSFGANTAIVQGGPPVATYDATGTASSSLSMVNSEQQHAVPSVTVTSYSATSKGRKYGTVVSETNSASYLAASPVKVKNAARGRNNSLSSYQSETTSYQRYSASPSRAQQQHFHPPPLTSSGQTHQAGAAGVQTNRDDQIFINGQQMTDETSARILQSLSQKSSSEAGIGTTKYTYKQPHFTFYGSDNVPQSPSNIAAAVPAASVNSGTPGVVYDPSDARFYEDKSDGRRSSTSESITTFADNIPLREGFPPTYTYNQRDDDDQIGIEVRPAPVDISNGRYHILQAIFQDHTYCAPLPELKLTEPPVVPVSAPQQQQQPSLSTQPVTQTLHASTIAQSQQQLYQPQQHQLQQPLQYHQQQQQTSQPSQVKSASSLSTTTIVSVPGAIPVVTSTAVISNATIPSSAVPAPLTQVNLSTLATISVSESLASSGVPTSITTGAPISISHAAPGGNQQQPPHPITATTLEYIYQQRQSLPQDDDANSVISTGSRNFNNTDNDLGEETETAPEGEGEDDSVTRCICDLTHDDGYMICCDKCSAWQHVDCMGIDRLNIPDEYNCEMCQPRVVDKNRARMLQMEKRKEQSLFLANNNLQLQVGDPAVSSTNLLNIPGSVTPQTSGKGANQFSGGKAIGGSKKNKTTGGSSKKKVAAEGGAAAKKVGKKSADSALNRVNGKRKELKKTSKKKGKPNEPNAEKMTNMIRTWIDNYERAMTNHYSPELRARLQAFSKMQSQNPLLSTDRLIPASCVANLVQKCTTVPHAGGKILISTGDIEPKTPIIEIRGKYMLSTQHKQLQSLFNMAANGKLSNNKNAGPFLFLYQFTSGGIELCVDTRTYGNDARFVRRSCRPNAEILHNIEKGVVHLYIVSTNNIKANTEITIKHDEQLIQRVGGVVILTHTTVTNLCACGLIKECQYSAQLSEGLFPAPGVTGASVNAISSSAVGTSSFAHTAQPVVSSTSVITSSKPTKGKKNNGALIGADGEKKPAKKRNSRSTSSATESRLRSISSSGDSTSELALYAQQTINQQPQPPTQQASPMSPMHQQSSPYPQLPGQFISQQFQQTAMHFIHHQQHQQQHNQPSTTMSSQPVYMYSPSPTHQPQIVTPPQPPQSQHPQTPPPMSPVLGLTARPGFYTEIKSPLSSPPLNLSGPPPLVIPVSSPVKSIPQLAPSVSVTSRATPPVPIDQYQLGGITSIPVASSPTPSQEERHPRLEVIHHQQQQQQHQQQQQQLHQQQLMEDILRIKIKSPIASPIKQETSPSPTACMLSPPPPPPIPIAQRIICAETLKNELFHSHYQHAPVSPSRQLQLQQQPQPAPLPLPQQRPQSPIKVEYPASPTMVEVKQEESPLSPPRAIPLGDSITLVQVKLEQKEIKDEVIDTPADEAIAVEQLPADIKKEEPIESLPSVIHELPPRVATPTAVVLPEELKEEIPSSAVEQTAPAECTDNVTSSPIKSSALRSAVNTPEPQLSGSSSAVPPKGGSNNSSASNSPESQHPAGSSTAASQSTISSSSSASKKKQSAAAHAKELDTKKEEKKPSRKLTREERKMEAIVKAFAKMEQSQQRKLELKEQRKEGKRRSVSSSTPDEGPQTGSSSSKRKSISSQKRKKKKSKSVGQHFGSPNTSRKKKVAKSANKSSKKSSTQQLKGASPQNEKCSKSENKEAELLLTFSQSTTDQQQQSQSSYLEEEVKPPESGGDLPNSAGIVNNNDNAAVADSISSLPMLSSACMLIEAAVGPLEPVSSSPSISEQDFKFPQKAKTKKSMSREWLSGHPTESTSAAPYRRITPEQDSGYMSEEKVENRKVVAPFDEELATPLGVDVTDPTMSIVAKKVEEFIAQSSPQPDDGSSGHKWDEKTCASSSSLSLSQEQNTAPTCSESAAVKKRWLRQAISEETDELTQASNSPPPPNGFTTPLKKRRVVRQSEDTPQSQTPQQAISGQKIDFSGHLQQASVTSFTENNIYWTNAATPLTYSHSVLDEKHAIDLSRTAPLRIPQQPRIAPYKIVPIAQALTPLHFTDPDPLPPPPGVQAHHHPLIPQQESREITLHQPVTVQVTSSTMMSAYEPLTSGPPPSAVAAMVPASLLPPEPKLHTSASQPLSQPHDTVPEGDYPGLYNAPVAPLTRAITRSKGSQKYIGSPAKFEPRSPAESLSSSITETPEKNSSYSESVTNSDVEDDFGRQTVTIVDSMGVEVPAASVTISHDRVVETTEFIAQSTVLEDEIVSNVVDEVVLGSATDSPTKDKSGELTCVPEVACETNFRLEIHDKQSIEEEEEEEEDVMDEGLVEHDLHQMDTSDATDVDNLSDCTKIDDQNVSSDTDLMKTCDSPMEIDEESAPVIEVKKRQKGASGPPEEEQEKNELEDLQKVIASFHSENIMNLISRNRKNKKNSSREKGGTEEKHRLLTRKQQKNKPNAGESKTALVATEEASSQPTTAPETDLLLSNECSLTPINSPESISMESPTRTLTPTPTPTPTSTPTPTPTSTPTPIVTGVPTPVPPPEEIPITTLGRSYSHPSWHGSDSYRDSTTEVRSFSTLRPDIPQISYNSPSTYQSTAARNLLSSLSVGSEPLSTLGSYRSSTSSFLEFSKSTLSNNTGMAAGTSSAASSIYQYRPSTEISSLLEKGFSTSRPSSFSTLSSSLGTERTTERLGGSTYLLSSTSTKVADNLSTLGSTGTSYPKIFTKTASHDPRLNPALTTPEPAAPITPKRKLSINEYRQRKMQSCATSSTSASEATTSSHSKASSSLSIAGGSSSCSSRDSSTGSNLISSSLGSNDVSSSISKELSLELELELGKSGGEDDKIVDVLNEAATLTTSGNNESVIVQETT